MSSTKPSGGRSSGGNVSIAFMHWVLDEVVQFVIATQLAGVFGVKKHKQYIMFCPIVDSPCGRILAPIGFIHLTIEAETGT